MLEKSNGKNDSLIMFLCVSPEDLERCWMNYGEDSYKILFFVKEGIPFRINGERVFYSEKTMIFLRDTDRCDFSPQEDNDKPGHTECYALFIGKNNYSSVKTLLDTPSGFFEFERGVSPRVFEIDDIQADKLIRELNDFNQSENVDGKEHLNYTKLLVAEIYYVFIVGGYRQTRHFADAPRWFNEYYDIISRPDIFTLPFERVIGLSGKTREHLSRVFRKVTGSMISEFIISKRINYACILLRDKEISINDVVLRSGFTNTGTFYSNFKKKTGQSPERYRKTIGVS